MANRRHNYSKNKKGDQDETNPEAPEKEIVIILNYQKIAYSTSEYQAEANSYKVIKTYMTSETKKGE